jgi:membrane-bound ClpP family serine protease
MDVEAGVMTALIVVLLVTGASLLIAEAHVVSHGVLGLAGIAALATGAVLAVDAAGGSLALALAFAVPVVLVLGALVAVAGRKTLQAHRRRAASGAEALVGRVGVVRRAVAPYGDVLVEGELWRARRSLLDDEAPALEEGEHVVVEQVRGLTVSVRRAEEWESLP